MPSWIAWASGALKMITSYEELLEDLVKKGVEFAQRIFWRSELLLKFRNLVLDTIKMIVVGFSRA